MIVTKNNIDILIEEINKIVDEVIDNYLNNGRELLRLCNKYEIIKTETGTNNCVTNNHKQKVLNFINDVNLRYSALISFYNILNNSDSSNSNILTCNFLKTYVDFLERVKKSKEVSDNIDKVIKILKGENNE